MDVMQVIEQQIRDNPVILYMKGTPQFPQCGFSARTVQAVMAVGEPFAYVNILEAPEIRANLPKYANWPTFPQLWVNGELVGGCDIVTEMAASGQLADVIKGAKKEG
ncbi:MAG: Grx4 family monothiol glutaredoxin [Gammaproteobacteria bacterium]